MHVHVTSNNYNKHIKLFLRRLLLPSEEINLESEQLSIRINLKETTDSDIVIFVEHNQQQAQVTSLICFDLKYTQELPLVNLI